MVREGYKLTEVGVIPEDWEIETLESVVPPGRKYGIVDGPFGSNLKSIHYKTFGIPIISSGYVTEGRFFADDYIYVDAEKFRQEKRSAVSGGDIVMAKIGARCGSSAIMPENHQMGILSGNALKITVNQAKHSTYFIWQILWNLYVKGGLENITAIGAQPAVSMANLKKYKIALPPKEEQTAIAQALSDVDALIASLDKLIAKKRHIKTGTMQQLLAGKKRLPGFGEGKSYKKTEFGVVPEDWDVLPLGELTSFVGSGKSIVKRGAGDYPLYGSTGVIGYSQIFDYENDSILVARVGANAGKLNFVSGRYGVSDNTIIIKLKNDLDIHFFFYQLGNKDLNSLVFGSGQPLITGTQIKNLSVVRPKTTEQRAIAAVLSDMDEEIAALETRRAKTQAIKQGMMQELLTGKTRLI